MNKITKAVAKVAALSPEALKPLLLKIRKGADAAITLPQTLHIIELVGGAWEMAPGYVATKGVNLKTGEPTPMEIYTANKDGDDWISNVRRGYKDREVASLPEQPTPGVRFITDVSKIGRNAYGWLNFTFVEWATVYGVRVEMPDGQSTLVLPTAYDLRTASDIDAFSTLSSVTPYNTHVASDLKKWLNEATDYKSRVCQLLEMEEHVPAAQRTRDNTGCCPVCFREMKLEPARDLPVMVHHGYQRPRYLGYTVGNCFGVGLPPYELSSEGVVQYLDRVLLPDFAHLEAMIDAVESDKLDEYPVPYDKRKRVRRGQQKDYLHSIPSFEEARERFHENLKREYKYQQDTIDTYKTFVSEWRLRELPVEGAPPRPWWREISSKLK